MRKYPILALLFALSSTPLLAQSGKISKEERAFLINYLQTTQTELLTAVNEISKSEWLAKPADGGWSPAECMAHILMAEQAVFKQVKKALANAAGTDDLKARDGWLLSKITDRGNKVKTPLPLVMKNSSKSEMLIAFKASRKSIYDFLANKKLPLRQHYGRSPYGKVDAYQLFIVIAGHSMRHTNQILEGLALVN